MESRPPNFGRRRLYQRRAAVRAGADLIEHLLRLQELAEASGQSFVEFVEGPAHDVAYAAGVVAGVKRVLARARPSSRTQGLRDLAATHSRNGTFGALVADALRAYAEARAGPRGNPIKLRGAASNPAREFVNAALSQLATDAIRGSADFGWLFAPGRPGAPSPGHARVVEVAHALALEAGARVSKAELSRQVTEARRSALSLRYGLSEWALTVRPRSGTVTLHGWGN